MISDSEPNLAHYPFKPNCVIIFVVVTWQQPQNIYNNTICESHDVLLNKKISIPMIGW